MKRPLTVTLISWLYILAGAVGIIYHAKEFDLDSPEVRETIWVLIVRVLAIIGGILARRGSGIGRSLLVAWIAYHVFISFYHSTSEVVTHAVIMTLSIIALFNRNARVFFGDRF